MSATNPIIECLLTHSSDRKYKPDPIDDSILNQILKSGHRAPTSKNAQDISVIVIKDPKKRQRIAELSSNQAWIVQCPVFLVLVGDWHKANFAMEQLTSKSALITETTEGIVTACTDAGIVLQAMMLAARSFDLGVVPIGGLRAGAGEISDLLKLPPRVVPIVGMCIGYVEKHAELKPRLDISTFVHIDEYNNDQEALKKAIEAHDKETLEHWKKLNRPGAISWSASMAETFDHDYRPNLREDMRKQLFKLP